MRGRRRSRRGPCLFLAAVLLCSSGCRTLGVGASWCYDWGAATFAPNPASVTFYYLGLGVSFVAASPLILLSWPLTALTYPDNEEAFYVYSILSPAHYLGVVVGTALAAPFYPFGWPFMPDEPQAVPGPGPGPAGGEEGQ